MKFITDLKDCIFDCLLVGIKINKDEYGLKEYERKRNECNNMKKKILYKIYQNKNKYYFSDNINYLITNEIKNYEKILSNSVFHLYVYEVFFDESEFNEIESKKFSFNELNGHHSNNKNKIVEQNGIQIEINKNSKNKFLGNKYILNENQIFPIYTLTLKLNTNFIFYIDTGAKNNQILEDIKNNNLFNFNIYYESSIEEALKFFLRRKYDKIILIASIENYFCIKRFIEITRKIYGFEVIILFIFNNKSDFEQIKDFPNCLFIYKNGNYKEFIKEYIKNYNEIGLENLRKKIEKEYDITLNQFSSNFLSFPNFKNRVDFSSINFKCENIRHVYIKNGNRYLCMSKDGNISINYESCEWDVTIWDKEITLFSNGLYLGIKEDKENIKGFIDMNKWKFNLKDEFYYFINIEKENNNILSINKEEIKVNKEIVGENEMFELIDVYADINNNELNSFLNEKINNVTSSIELSD